MERAVPGDSPYYHPDAVRDSVRHTVRHTDSC